ncbi:MAG: VanW family protein [Rhizobiales bacterium]|nr:VanW family protein [Hyphomicrobiales bacterium]
MTDHALRRIPSRWDMAAFGFKATLFRLRRTVLEAAARQNIVKYQPTDDLAHEPILAHITSPLWNALSGPKEYALTAGKIQNLRMAVRAIDGVEVPAGEVFSFWRQIGRTTKSRGYVNGRELREGCLIKSVGGGLCQLSNGLYEAALNAGLEIVERHAHSRIVPGSRAARERDATVFWNYVDLRFRSDRAFRIEARLARGMLEIVIRGRRKDAATQTVDSLTARETANDCTSCNETTCHLHDPEVMAPAINGRPTAWLVDACWPEFATLLAARASRQDALFLPQRVRKTDRHAWPHGFCGSETRATFTALRRALALRRAPAQGRALQSLMLRYDAALAERYARGLSYLHTHAVVSQSLLPHLWRAGALAGRSFEVLMERSPISHLQATLDEAAARYPNSPTLGDFRAPAGLAEAEEEALAEATRIYTPHRQLATLYPDKTELLDWMLPCVANKSVPGGKTILFPASALGRKGAYALRDAMQGLDAELVVTGRAREHDGEFWKGVRVTNGGWPDRVAAVVLPTIVEHQPRALLRAIAMGLPVIATEACGLGNMPGVITVPACDVSKLRNALKAALEPESRLAAQAA